VNPTSKNWSRTTILVVLFWVVLSETFDYTSLLVTKSERGRRVAAAQEKMTALILKLDGLLRDQGIEFVLVVLPAKRDVELDTYEELRNLQGLVDFCRSNGVATLEVKPYFIEQLRRHSPGDRVH
jgi:hypothetical protein